MDTSFAQRRRRDLIVAACFAVIAALVPLFVHDVYVQNIMVLTLMYAALSQSWNILSGYCGQISLGHALYFGLGAYTTALLFTKFGGLPWFGMVGGGLISAAIAMALGYPCFRLRGHYFVIATIVIAETALLLFQNWDWAGAALGIDIPVRRDSWLTFQFTRSKLPYFYFALALACVAWFVTWWLKIPSGAIGGGRSRITRTRPKASAWSCSIPKWGPRRFRRFSPRSAAVSMRSSCPISTPKA